MVVRELNQKQIEKLSDIIADIGVVGFASVVIPAAFDKFDIADIILGVIAALLLFVISLWLRR